MINLALTSYLSADLPISYLCKEIFPENPYQVYLHILTALARTFTSPWSCELHSHHSTGPEVPRGQPGLQPPGKSPKQTVASKAAGQTDLLHLHTLLSMGLVILKDPLQPQSWCNFPQERQ